MNTQEIIAHDTAVDISDQEIENAINNYLDLYPANLPDALEVIQSAITRYCLFHVEGNERAQQSFKDLLCEIIMSTEI